MMIRCCQRKRYAHINAKAVAAVFRLSINGIPGNADCIAIRNQRRIISARAILRGYCRYHLTGSTEPSIRTVVCKYQRLMAMLLRPKGSGHILGTFHNAAALIIQAEHRQHNRAGFAAGFQRRRALFLVPNAFCCRRRFRQETCRSTSCFCSMSRLQPRLNPQRFLQLGWQTLLSFFRAPQDTQAGSTAQRVFGWG